VVWVGISTVCRSGIYVGAFGIYIRTQRMRVHTVLVIECARYDDQCCRALLGISFYGKKVSKTDMLVHIFQYERASKRSICGSE
jgi:hypothetical protein